MAAVWTDPEWYKVAGPLLEEGKKAPKAELHDSDSRRAKLDGLFQLVYGGLPDLPDIEKSHHKVKSYDGAEVDVYRFAKPGASGPALLHSHGGGMIAGTVNLEMMGRGCALEASMTGIQIFSVDYRLAPEHPHPAPTEDVYAALVWLQEHAKEFNVDPARIAVYGQSAGGGISAGVALMARDRKLSPPLAKQILVYPMLDDRNLTLDPQRDDLAVWNNSDNITGWNALLGRDKPGTDDVSPYAAPLRAKDVSGLPPTYIDVGGLDLFRDEDIAYAAKIAATGTPLEFHMYAGVPHAFEALGGPTCDVTTKAFANRAKAMASI